MITRAIQLGFGREVSGINSAIVPKVILHDYLTQTFGIAGGGSPGPSIFHCLHHRPTRAEIVPKNRTVGFDQLAGGR